MQILTSIFFCYNIMLNKFRQNPAIWHFLAYCISFFGYGAILTGLGPLIPYLAEEGAMAQTEYSFLFLCRAVGFVIGSLLTRVTQKYFSFHQVLIIFSALVCVFASIFSVVSTVFPQVIFMTLLSIACAITEIILNVSIITSNRDNDQEFWIQIGHGMFGVGGLVGPILVYLLEKNSYVAFGLIMFSISPAYYILLTPETGIKQEAKEIIQAGRITSVTHRNSRRQREQRNILNYICFMFFIYIGQEVAFGGWISSYAVLAGVASKESAVKYGSIFWIMMTVFRFGIAFYREKTSTKLRFLIQLQIGTTLVCLAAILFQYMLFTVVFSSLIIGISFSGMFGLFISLPNEFGLILSCTETSSFLLFGQIGEGVISMMVGYLMGIFSIHMLYVSILLCGLLIYFAVNKTVENLEKLDRSSSKSKSSHRLSLEDFQKKGKGELQLKLSSSL